MNDPNNPCIFCKINQKELIFENDYAYASSDSYPVSQLHSLVVPKRCIENYFELDEKEILACNDLIKKLKKKIRKDEKKKEGLKIESIFHQKIIAILETQLII